MTTKPAPNNLQLNPNTIAQALLIAAVLAMCGYIWDSTADNARDINRLAAQVQVIEARHEGLVEVPARLRSIENKLAAVETKIDTLQGQKP